MAPESATAEPARGRGRPRQFDEDEVLEKLMNLFWDRGFEAASLNDMVEAAGLNKSSLYNTFGSKEQVFACALDRYMDFRRSMMSSTLDGSRGFDELAVFFDVQRAEVSAESGFMGCFAVNAQTELGLRDPKVVESASDYRSMMRDALRPGLTLAAEQGVIDGELIETYLDALVAFTVALAVNARSGATTEELLHQIDSAERLTETWRRSTT